MGRPKRKRRPPQFHERPVADQIDIFERALAQLARQIQDDSKRILAMGRTLQRLKRAALLGQGEEDDDV